MKLSRHVKNNMKLYKIKEEDIAKAIKTPDFTENQDDKFIAIKKFPRKFARYPLKVVYEKLKDDELIISAYPLKKQHWRKP